MKKQILIAFLLIIFIASIFIFSKKEAEKPSLDEKIGEMLILGFRGLEVDSSSKIIKDINDYHLGGVILFNYDVPSSSQIRNIENEDQVKKLISDIKKLSNKNLLIAVDAEGGCVNRLKKFTNIKSASEMGKEDVSETFNQGLILGEELKKLGFNVNFAPVVDVNINEDNPVIGQLERSFSKDPEEVYIHASSFIDAMHENNIMTAIKHFPGHGSSENDSHLGLTDVTNTYNKEIELLPYKKLIKENKLDMIMTAHIMNRNIDSENPATLSSIFLKDILRGELKYEGVIVSDDMQMGAIVDNFGFKESLIKAINAGCDLLIFSNNNKEYDENIAEKAIKIIKEAVSNGEIKEEQINESYDRIKRLKQAYNL